MAPSGCVDCLATTGEYFAVGYVSLATLTNAPTCGISFIRGSTAGRTPEVRICNHCPYQGAVPVCVYKCFATIFSQRSTRPFTC